MENSAHHKLVAKKQSNDLSIENAIMREFGNKVELIW